MASLRVVEAVLETTACVALLGSLIEWRLDPRPDVSTLRWVTILLPLSLLVLGKARGPLACLVVATAVAITAPVVAADLGERRRSTASPSSSSTPPGCTS